MADELDTIVEKFTLRTENSKTFDLGNGRRRVISHISAIHYKDNYTDKTEQWKDIDLNWEGNRITKAPYELTHEGDKLTLRDKKTGKITTIELDSIGGKKISDIAWEKSKGLLKAPGIAQDTDFEVIAEFSAVRFRRVLKSDKAPQKAKFKVIGDTSLVSVRAFDEEGDIPTETSFKDGILIETLKPDREIKYPIKIDPILNLQVEAGNDDCSRAMSGDYWDLSSINQIGGSTPGVWRYGGGMRFTDITVPKGATIVSAYLTLRCSVSNDDLKVRTKISAEDIDNPVAFVDSFPAFDTRYNNHTTAMVNWDDIPAWTLNVDYNSPEIETVIQEIVDRGGWNSGQAIVIFWEDFDSRSTYADSGRKAYSYDGSTEFAPKLFIEYTPPPIALISTAVIAISTTGALSRGITESLLSTANIVGSITSSLSRGVTEILTSTANIATSVTGNLSRGITQTLASTANIVTSISGNLSRGVKKVLTSTANITTSIISVLGRGITEALNSTVNIVVSITANLSKEVIALISTAVITSSITSSLSRGVKEVLTSTSSITSSITGRLTRIINLSSVSAIVTSITSVLSRGITGILNSTSAITTSITSSLSRGIKKNLASVVNIETSITAKLTKFVIVLLNSTANVTTSILGRLSRTRALTSTVNITTSIIAKLKGFGPVLLNSTANIVTSIISTLTAIYDWAKVTKEGSDFQEVTKENSDWSKVEKGESDWNKTRKG